MEVKKYKNLEEYVMKEFEFEKNNITHEMFYSIICDSIGIKNLIPLIPEQDKNILKKKFKEDKYFNNIPLELWDNKEAQMRSLFSKLNIKSCRLSDCVCVLKESARIYIDME